MKKHYGLILFFVALVSTGWTVCSQAMELIPVTSFDSTWVTDSYGTGTSTVTTDGAKVNLSAQGSATDYAEKDFYKTGTIGTIGMMATLQVDQSTSPNSSTSIGIYQYLGQIGNEKIQLMIQLNQVNNQNRIWYRIRSADLTTNAKTVIGQGTFGDTTEGWTIGKSVTVALARVGSEYWLYVVGLPGLAKLQFLNELMPYPNNSRPAIVVWADKGASISGSVSNIYLIKE